MYTMTTLRLTAAQKQKLRKAAQVLEASRGRKMSQGDVVEILTEFALRHRGLLVEAGDDADRLLADDPFFDLSLSFDMGRTDERTHDRILYGR
jgi:hypothetical protein